MTGGEFLRGRALGRTEALLVYCDESLSDTQRGDRLLAVADRLAGDELTGFWRGANEIRPEAISAETRTRVQAGDFDDLPPDAGVAPPPARPSRIRLAAVVAIGLLVAVLLGLVVHLLVA